MFGFRKKASQTTPDKSSPFESASGQVEDTGETSTSAAGTVSLRAPVAGRLLALEDVPDPVFSRGLAGPGFAVDPASGIITAPVPGTVVMLAETHHAVGLTTANGAEIVVHVGVDSVTLKGEGLHPVCAAGDEVQPGQPLLEVDLDLLRERLPSTITPVLVTNADGFELEGPDLAATGESDVLIVRRR